MLVEKIKCLQNHNKGTRTKELMGMLEQCYASHVFWHILCVLASSHHWKALWLNSEGGAHLEEIRLLNASVCRKLPLLYLVWWEMS